MIPKHPQSIRWFIPWAAMLLGSACIVEAAGSAATPQVIVITGGDTGAQDTAAASPTPETAAAPADTPQPTATATIAQVTMTADQDLSCVTGPHWILFEWVAKISEGETVVLLARAEPEWGEYYFVQKSSGTPASCWAFGGSSILHGDPSILPVKGAPPLPAVTYTVENGMYLRIADIFIRRSGEAAWGADRLGAGMISPAASFGIPLTAGFYDVQMKDEWGEPLYEEYNIPIGPEPSSSNRRLENRYSVTILNSSGTNVCRLNISALLAVVSMDITIPGDGILAAGETIEPEGVAGIYWFKAFRCGDNALFREIGGFRIGSVHKSYNLP